MRSTGAEDQAPRRGGPGSRRAREATSGQTPASIRMVA